MQPCLAISAAMVKVPVVSIFATTTGTPVHSRFECLNRKVRFRSTCRGALAQLHISRKGRLQMTSQAGQSHHLRSRSQRGAFGPKQNVLVVQFHVLFDAHREGDARRGRGCGRAGHGHSACERSQHFLDKIARAHVRDESRRVRAAPRRRRVWFRDPLAPARMPNCPRR